MAGNHVRRMTASFSSLDHVAFLPLSISLSPIPPHAKPTREIARGQVTITACDQSIVGMPSQCSEIPFFGFYVSARKRGIIHTLTCCKSDFPPARSLKDIRYRTVWGRQLNPKKVYLVTWGSAGSGIDAVVCNSNVGAWPRLGGQS